MRIIFLLFFFVTSIFAVSLRAANLEWKNGYIITLESDTIYGQVGLHNNEKDHRECSFKDASGGGVSKYSPKQIIGYGTNEGLLYNSLEVEYSYFKGDFFVQLLFEGIINLYYIESPQKSLYLYVFKKRNEDRLIYQKGTYSFSRRGIDQQRLKITLSMILENNPDIQKSLNKVTGDRDNLINLLTDYHYLICDDTDTCIVYAESKPGKTHRLGVYWGGNWNFLSLKTGQKTYKSTHLYPFIGLNYSTPLKRFSEKWNIDISLEASYLNFKNTRVSYKEITDYKLSAMTLRNNILFDYRYTLSSIKPSVIIGISQEGMFPSKNEFTNGESQIGQKLEDDSMGYNKYRIDLVIGAAAYISLKNKNEIPIRLLYNQGVYRKKGFNNSLDSPNSISLSMGYSFKL